ncbi:hypothetical protein [Xanthovirga aplysinae]|uniref:type IX secretion system anionic LPS delivery protein PorZ n=1 Tax=Xanthovirga aplysinae TaxID=2529853 RepID=UPI0012BCD373|nr:hypothetical protein [Xanthovirga aplysinae]MTI33619.1 hypothetical protein [Xanthovirga aplysinae]
MKNILVYSFLLMCAHIGAYQNIYAQTDIPVGNWRTHFSYRQTNKVVVTENRIYCATNHSLFYLDKDDNSLNKLTKMDGLSENTISTMAYNSDLKILLIGYVDGNVDLLSGNGLLNFSEIKDSRVVQNKAIRQVSFEGNRAFLSTGFGLAVLDLDQMEVRETYANLGIDGEAVGIYSSVIFNSKIFITSDAGILSAPVNDRTNLLDYNNWKRFGDNEGLPDKEFRLLSKFKDKVYAATDSELYAYDGEQWELLNDFSEKINSISGSGNSLIISLTNSIKVYEEGQPDFQTITSSLTTSPQEVIQDQEGLLWVADLENGLVTNREGEFKALYPEGPFHNKINRLYSSNGLLIAFSDEQPASIGDNGFDLFEEGNWINYGSQQEGELRIPFLNSQVNDVVVSPIDRKFYFSTSGDGLLVWSKTDLNLFNTDNSDLISDHLTAITSDELGSIWLIGQSNGNQLLQSLSPEGHWVTYSLTDEEEFNEILVYPGGEKWMIKRGGSKGIFVFNEESRESKALNTLNTIEPGLPDNNISQMAIDRNPYVWVTTGKGVAYFSSPLSVLSEALTFVVRPISDDHYLLNNQTCTALAVDGGNRKWIGTTQGLWLFNEYGEQLIQHFTEENSPLPSDMILDLAINDQNGELFIATDQGLVSFRSDATPGMEAHENVRIFPNPVTSDFGGLVGIDGLAEDVTLKIAGASGRVVRTFKANGGMASWDLKDEYGRRVNTGVYLVFSSTADGQETFVGKIAVIN